MRKILKRAAAFSVALTLTLTLSSCAASTKAPEAKPAGVFSPNAQYEFIVGSTAWQLSAESQALMQQAFSLASGKIREMAEKCESDAEPDWSYEENGGARVMTYKGKPVAVISDIDDTLVDGAHYTANIVGKDGDYNNAAFTRFVMSEGCTALPGAVDFVKLCAQSGVEVFYITNRYDQGYKVGQYDSKGGYPKDGGGKYLAADGKEIGTTTYQVFGKSFYDITLESMKRLGFPIDDKHLILNDTKLKGASKQKARDAVISGCADYPTGQRSDGNATGSALTLSCGEHYVPLLLGDQMSDFTDDFSSKELDAVTRAKLTSKYAENIGKTWILLPNAVYGGAVDYATAYGMDRLFENYDYTVSGK